MDLSVAVSGDAILNRRVSVLEDPDFVSLIEPLRSADVGFTHLETLLFDYDDPGVHPAAEAGGTWMRSPPFVAEELAWAGIDVVSHASNHALDYGYGALESTWAALATAGIDHAGVGRNLAAARDPTYREVTGGRVALVSTTTSFTRWSRAGEARRDVPGRPGVNPLGYHYAASPASLERIRDVAEAMGLWITPGGDGEWLLNPPGLHNTLYRFVEDDDVDGIQPVLDEADRRDNLRAIEEADRQADLTIAHVHTPEWDVEGDLSDPAPFLPPFARDCVDAGADVVVCQGSHAPLRGIDVHEGRPIFYDPGDLFMMSDTVEALPAEFYTRYADRLDGHPADARPGEALSARGISAQFGEGDDSQSDYGGRVENPPGGYFSGRVLGNVVPVCTFEQGDLLEVELHPGVLRDSPALYRGVPVRASGSAAEAIVEYVDDLSTPFGTDVAFEAGVGVVDLAG